MSSDMQIATVMARRKAQESEKAPSQKNKLAFTLLLLSHICVCVQYMLYQTLSFFLFVFSGLGWYFCLAGDVSGWTRSATLRGGQVSKKHESKAL